MRWRVLAGPALFCLAWAAVAHSGIVRRLFLPPPEEVACTLVALLQSRQCWIDTGETVWRWLAGVFVGSLLGVAVGLTIGVFRSLDESTSVLLDALRSVPVISLFPLFLIFFGIGDTAKIAVAAWAATLFMSVNVAYGVRYSRAARGAVARVFRATPTQTLIKFVLPGALPSLFVGVRTSLSLGLVVVIAAEMVMGATNGLGRRIFDDALVYETARMYAGIVLVGLLGYASNRLSVLLERRLLHWAEVSP